MFISVDKSIGPCVPRVRLSMCIMSNQSNRKNMSSVSDFQ